MSSTERYVLNTVQNPKLLEIAYRSIDRGNQSQSDLEEDTGLTAQTDRKGTLDQATDGLLTFGLIRKSDYEFSVEPLAFDTGDWGLDFRMTMLHNVAQEATEPEWGKQSAVILNYEYLLANGIQYFRGTDSELRDNIDRWHQEIGYEPRNQNGKRQDLNPEKFSHWRNQAEYLALLHSTGGQSSTYTVAPAAEFIVASVLAAAEHAGDGDGIETSEYLDWLSSNLFRVPLTTEHEFTEPMARTFYRLAKVGKLEFVKRGDAEQIGLQSVPVASNPRIAKNANYIRVAT